MKALTTLFALLTIPLIVVAQAGDSFECTMGGLVRRVSIEREGAAAAPCEVAYYKATEAPGERQVLWNADNDAGYCATRASEFVSRLEGWGWQCAASSAGRDTATDENGAR